MESISQRHYLEVANTTRVTEMTQEQHVQAANDTLWDDQYQKLWNQYLQKRAEVTPDILIYDQLDDRSYPLIYIISNPY